MVPDALVHVSEDQFWLLAGPGSLWSVIVKKPNQASLHEHVTDPGGIGRLSKASYSHCSRT